MKKEMKLSLCLLGALALASCGKNTNVPNGGDDVKGGNTYAGLTVSLASGLRADGGQEDNAGVPEECNIARMHLLSSVQDQSWVAGDENTDGKFWENTTGDNRTYMVAPWKTVAGPQTMGLILNEPTGSGVILANPEIDAAVDYMYGDKEAKAASMLSKNDNFTMTSKVVSEVIKKGITKEAVKDGSGKDKNVFAIPVERVVVKGVVKKGANLHSETADKKGFVSLEDGDLTYAPVNSALKTYYFANHAGDRQMTNKQYGEFKSAIHGAVFKQKPEEAKAQGLIRLGNYKDGVAAAGGVFGAKKVEENTVGSALSLGFYFFENSSEPLTENDGAIKEKGFYRYAYAKVYAIYTPKEVWVWENDALVKKTDEAAKTALTDKTFYKGVTDGRIYATKEAAAKSQTAKGQGAYTYKKGKCAYRALWNRITTGSGENEKVVNASVRRNNIYVLTITEFSGLGMPWDPSDPNDPNLPQPDDDKNLPDPDDPSIEKQDTYMRVQAEVQPWNVVSRDVVLE